MKLKIVLFVLLGVLTTLTVYGAFNWSAGIQGSSAGLGNISK